MATIITNRGKKKTTYSVQIRVKGAKPIHATFDRRRDATDFAKKTEADIRAGRYGTRSESMRHTFSDLLDRYFKSYEVPRDQAAILEWWRTEIGHQALANVTPPLLSAVRDKLAKEKNSKGRARSPSTVNRYFAYMSAVFGKAKKEWHLIEQNPFSSIKKLREPQGRVRFLSDSERDKLLAACKDSSEPHLYEFVVLALQSGARAGELQGLDWSDIDFNRGVAILEHTKNRRRRTIPIRGLALELLRDRRGISGPVFHSADGRVPFDYSKPFREAVSGAGIENFRFHDCRHTAASALAQAGCSLLEIAELLGHQSLTVTQRYAHLTDKTVTDLGDKLDKLMFRS